MSEKNSAHRVKQLFIRQAPNRTQPGHYSWPNIYHDFYKYFPNVSWCV